MANRFVETNYYKSPYVRSLKGPLKALYSFIILDCTPSGIWSLDVEAASLYTGFEIKIEDFYKYFFEKGKAIDLGGGKYFFPDFIEHQYPGGLQRNNKAHKNVIFELEKLKLIDENLRVIRGALKPLGRGTGLGLGHGHDQGQGNKEGGVGETNGLTVIDAEKTILENKIEFERICMTTGKDPEHAKTSLRKFHLHLQEKEQYPKGRKAVFAGFEKWLMNEKASTNGKGTKTNQSGNSGKPAANVHTSRGTKNL